MNIRLAQMEVIPGNPKKNFQKASMIVAESYKDNVEVIVFPELCISGYLIGDMWEESSFIDDCMYYGDELAKMSSDKLTIIFGNVYRVSDAFGNDGRPAKVNAVFVAQNGDYININGGKYQPKILLPNYREFDESRYFQTYEWYRTLKYSYHPVKDSLYPVVINGVNIGLTICEDGWDCDYDVKPITILSSHGAEIIINISCSPFTTGKNIARDKTFSTHAFKNNIPVLYVNSVGCQNNGKTIFTFDGSSVAYNKNGDMIELAPMFTESVVDVLYSNHNITNGMDYDTLINTSYDEIEEIYNSLVYGISHYMKQCGLSKVVIGSSGGIDSAVTAALYAKVVGKENLLLVNMPSEFNSKTTIELSKKLADNIGCYYTTIPIGDSVELTKNQVNGIKIQNNTGNTQTLNLSDFDLENVQARDRSSRILSSLSSAFGGVFTNNGNKTEVTVGYCTIYGDVAGFLSAIGDLWKGQVYELGKYINRKSEVIPIDIFNIQPSAELSGDQSIDIGLGDPFKYWYHDKLFKSWVENWNRATPSEIADWYLKGILCNTLGIDTCEDKLESLFKTNEDFINDLEHWWKLFKGMGISKRVQSPPVLAVSRRAFGFDYRETLNCSYLGRRYEQIKEILLEMDKKVNTNKRRNL